jgi:hypothetical protein
MTIAAAELSTLVSAAPSPGAWRVFLCALHEANVTQGDLDALEPLLARWPTEMRRMTADVFMSLLEASYKREAAPSSAVWHVIRHVEVEMSFDQAPADWLGWLTLCPQLRALRVPYGFSDEEDIAALVHVLPFLPALQELEVGGSLGPSFFEQLEQLSLPALRRLRVTHEEGVEAPLQALCRSGQLSSLAELTLRGPLRIDAELWRSVHDPEGMAGLETLGLLGDNDWDELEADLERGDDAATGHGPAQLSLRGAPRTLLQGETLALNTQVLRLTGASLAPSSDILDVHAWLLMRGREELGRLSLRDCLLPGLAHFPADVALIELDLGMSEQVLVEHEAAIEGRGTHRGDLMFAGESPLDGESAESLEVLGLRRALRLRPERELVDAFDGCVSLHTLDLAANDLDAEGLRTAFGAFDLSGLRALQLSLNPLGREGVAWLEDARELEVLEVAGCQLDDAAMRRLVAQDRSELRRLDVGHNPFTPTWCRRCWRP